MTGWHIEIWKFAAMVFVGSPILPGFTLPETNSLVLLNDGWKMILSYWGPAYFQGQTCCSFQGGTVMVGCWKGGLPWWIPMTCAMQWSPGFRGFCGVFFHGSFEVWLDSSSSLWLASSLIHFKVVFCCCFGEELWREQHNSSNPMARGIPIEILRCVIKCCLCELDRVLTSEIYWQIHNARNIYKNPAVCSWLKMMEKRKKKQQIQLRDQWPIWNRPILRKPVQFSDCLGEDPSGSNEISWNHMKSCRVWFH